MSEGEQSHQTYCFFFQTCQTPDQLTKLNWFWHELKRRNIVRRNTVYLATAYVIIEFISIISEPFDLPGWTLKFVLVFLSIGFIVSLIISWNYKVSSEGFQRIESDISALKLNNNGPKPAKRKIKGSDFVIAVLAVFVLVLAYPRIFKGGGNLQAMTRTVTVVNEFGELETHEIFNKNELTHLAIFPFSNEGRDSSLDWLQHGIFEAVGEDLSQFTYMSVNWNEDQFQLHEQIEVAQTKGLPYFLAGTYRQDGEIYEIKSKLYQTGNGGLLKERMFKGRDFFALVDSISLQTRIDLGIPGILLNSSVDLPFQVFYTDNLKEFEYCIKGNFIDSSSYNFNKAVELDSTFAMALLYRADRNYHYQINEEAARKDIRQAMRHRKRMTDFREIATRIRYYSILGEKEKAIALAEMQQELKPYDFKILIDLISVYQRYFLVHKMEEAVIKLNELVPGQRSYQLLLANSYLLTENLSKGIELLEYLIQGNPEDTEALMQLGEMLLHKGNLEAAEKIYQRAILLNPDEEKYWSRLLDHIEYVRNNKWDHKSLENLTGYYQFESGELGLEVFVHNKHLMAKGSNQGSQILYPVSDSVYVSTTGYFVETFLKNQQNKVSKLISRQRNLAHASQIWKEDPLILKSKELLSEGQNTEALQSFQKAHENFPDHYYLAHYIQYLEFAQSPDYENYKTIFANYSGEYKDLQLYTEGNHIYFKNQLGYLYKLYPLTENSFMMPARLETRVHVVQEKGVVSGLNFVYRDGDEIFHPRTN